MKLFISVLAFMTVLIGVVGCTSDTLELAPNGDSRLREISFKGKNLVPEFSPTITQYSIYSDGSDLVFGKILTYMFHTKFTLNGSTVRMNTNGYRLPDNTDLTSYFTNSLVNPGSKVMVIDTVALDGNKRKYTVTLRGDASDASLKDISSTNAILREPFKEYPAPLYRASSYPQDFYSDQYYLTASTNYAHILIRKSQADAKLFSSVSPTVEQGPGIKDVVLGFTNFGSSYNGTLYYITNVSADGQTRNVKQIWIRFYQPANDGRILQLTACRENTDMEIPYLPKFINTANNTYSLLADNCETISFKGIKSQQDAVVSVKIDGVANNSLVSTASDGVSFTVSAIQVTTGTVIEISCNKGSGTMTHTFNVRAFTKTPYGFDGKISELIRDIQTRKEIPSGSGYNKQIEGVVTFLTDYDETKRAGWFMEDGAYGIYVWSWNGHTSGIKVGHRIRMTVTAAKVWMNMPEVTDAIPGDTVILESGKQYPLHYMDGNDMNFGEFRHLGRMLRFSTYKARAPITATYDDNGMGNFTPNKAFKLFIPYTKSLNDLQTTYKPESLTYMTAGKEGIFFGPSFLDGDGASIMMKGKDYMIVP